MSYYVRDRVVKELVNESKYLNTRGGLCDYKLSEAVAFDDLAEARAEAERYYREVVQIVWLVKDGEQYKRKTPGGGWSRTRSEATRHTIEEDARKVLTYLKERQLCCNPKIVRLVRRVK